MYLIEWITVIILAISIIDTIVFMFIKTDDYTTDFFNPVRNYKKWTRMNWFGVIFFTALLNILCPGYALCYWFWKLCTVGREKSHK